MALVEVKKIEFPIFIKTDNFKFSGYLSDGRFVRIEMYDKDRKSEYLKQSSVSFGQHNLNPDPEIAERKERELQERKFIKEGPELSHVEFGQHHFEPDDLNFLQKQYFEFCKRMLETNTQIFADEFSRLFTRVFDDSMSEWMGSFGHGIELDQEREEAAFFYDEKSKQINMKMPDNF